MPSLFRRRTEAADRPDHDPAETDPAETDRAEIEPAGDEPTAGSEEADDRAEPRAGVKPKGYTPGKGRATPKRREARRRSAEPPPKDRKEAYRRMRGRQKQERAEARAAMMRGEEKYLPPRDRGPERRLVRDIVDARRNIATWFFGVALLILLVGALPVPPQVRFGVDILWVVMLVAIVVDSVLLSRLIGRLVRERHPDTTVRIGGLYFYAIMRSLTLRRMRIPAPQVSIGDKV